VRDLGSELATALLRESPTAAGFHGVPVRRVALGSCWGLAVFAAMLPFLLWRLLAEERILARDFTGIRRIPAARPVPSRAVHLVTFVRTVDFCPGRSTYW
jgi:protein-S-isoprenylcysteine O-methyltransferase Ste14